MIGKRWWRRTKHACVCINTNITSDKMFVETTIFETTIFEKILQNIRWNKELSSESIENNFSKISFNDLFQRFLSKTMFKEIMFKDVVQRSSNMFLQMLCSKMFQLFSSTISLNDFSRFCSKIFSNMLFKVFYQIELKFCKQHVKLQSWKQHVTL